MLKRKQQPLSLLLLTLLSNVWVLLSVSPCSLVVTSRPLHTHSPVPSNISIPPDALALIAFKSKADPKNHLLFSASPNSSVLHFCKYWPGVQCIGQKVVRLVLQNLDLGGVLAPNTLSLLDQLRVLSLQNNSLSGPIPDLSGLVNLKSLFLDHNHFEGPFPPSILSLHRLRTLDFSHNNFSGPLPSWLSTIDRFYYLRLDLNSFSGSIPPLNQSALRTFNVSGNNLTGAIPITPTLLRFEPSSFTPNPSLCGEIIHKECHPSPPFFRPTTPATPPTMALGQSAGVHGPVDNLIAQPYQKKHNRTAIIIGFSSGFFILICSLFCFMMALKKKQKQGSKKEKDYYSSPANIMAAEAVAAAEAAAAMQMEQEKELEEKVRKVQGMQMGKSGSLVFCAGEARLYSLDQLMKASAELMGRGTVGTTYKAVLDNRLIVSVKRLDATKMDIGTTKEVFERHMESVGGLRHPNLVPLRAYFQAKEEKLLIYDYQPNGSLFSLIHGKLN